MPKTIAMWVCNSCDSPVVKPKKGVQAAIREHKRTCPKATFQIKQVKQ